MDSTRNEFRPLTPDEHKFYNEWARRVKNEIEMGKRNKGQEKEPAKKEPGIDALEFARRLGQEAAKQNSIAAGIKFYAK